MMRCLVGLALAWAAAAQTYPAAFDVASIKRATSAPGEGGNRSRIEHTPESLTMRNVDLKECVQWAYGLPPFRISAAHWSTEKYDILAKSGTAVPVSQIRMMLQDLLAKRFGLVTHRETRTISVFELTVAKGGHKLPPSKSDVPVHAAESLPRVQGDDFLFADISMPELAAVLPELRGVEYPVVDRTGIKGTFDIVLKSGAKAALDGDRTWLFGLIEEQYGLKLSPGKAAVEVLVVDRAERPRED